MKTILVYSPEEARRNRFVVEKFERELGAVTVPPDYRGEASLVINRSNDYKVAEYYDKQLFYDFMEKNGIEILPTRYSTPPFVKKPRDSHGGNGVVMCRNESDYDENFVCQKPATDLGRDVRVWVLGGKIVASILRVSDTDFRSNYCLGGRAEIYDLSKAETQKVQKIIDLVTPLGAHYYGADFLFDNGRMIFNELEDTVGARMIYDKTDIDIIDMYIKYIKSKCLT